MPAILPQELSPDTVDRIIDLSFLFAEKYNGINDRWKKGQFDSPSETFLPGLAGEFAFHQAMKERHPQFPAVDERVLSGGKQGKPDFIYRGRRVEVKTISTVDGRLLIRRDAAIDQFDFAVWCATDARLIERGKSTVVNILGWQTLWGIQGWLEGLGKGGQWVNYEGELSDLDDITVLTQTLRKVGA